MKLSKITRYLAITAVSTILPTINANAAGYEDYNMSYIKAGAGFSLSSIGLFDPDYSNTKVTESLTYDVQAAYGKRLDDRNSVELSVAINAGTNTEISYGGTSGSRYKSEIKVTSAELFLSGLYDVWGKSDFRSYIVAGAGLNVSSFGKYERDDTQLSKKFSLSVDKTKGMAWQAGFGISYDLFKDMTIHIDYRLRHSSNSKFKVEHEGQLWKFRRRARNVIFFSASYSI